MVDSTPLHIKSRAETGCKRSSGGKMCGRKIVVGDPQGACPRHISREFFHRITGQQRAKLTEARAQKLVETKCKEVGEYLIPAFLLPQATEIVEKVFEEMPDKKTIILGDNVGADNAKEDAAKARESLMFTMEESDEEDEVEISTEKCVWLKPTFVEALKASSPRAVPLKVPDVNIAYKEPLLKDGLPTFVLTKEEHDATLEACKWHLVMKFVSGKPLLGRIREIIHQNWGLENKVVVGMLNGRNFLIKAHSEKDFNSILARDTMLMDGCRGRLLKWAPHIEKNEESPIMNGWIRLPSLPTNLFAPTFLKGIGNAISKYIEVDPKTISKVNPGYARLSVKLDLSKPMPEIFLLGTYLEDGFWQEIIIEGRT